MIRVEKGGVVVSTSDRRFSGGEDVRIWFALDGTARSFEASVIRAGVPIPDRSQDGLMLGFIDRWAEGAAAGGTEGRVLELIPPNGPAVSLLESGARLLHIAVDGLSFTVDARAKLVWVESGRVLVRLGIPGSEPVHASARVRSLASEEGYLLYDLHFEEVDDMDAHRLVIAGLATLL